MFAWLKSLFTTPASAVSKQAPPMRPTVEPTRPAVQLEQNVAASTLVEPIAAPSARARAPQFKTKAVQALYDEVMPLSHSEYPFLDKQYSPGSYMPAVDFTPWVAAWKREGDLAAIDELLGYLAYTNQAQAVRKVMSGLDFTRYIRGDQALIDELWAISFLVYRYPESGRESNRISLLRELISHSLASWSFELVDDALPHLLTGANAFIRKRNREMKDVAVPDALLDSGYLSNLQVKPVSSVGEELRRFPVSFRATITYSIERGSPAMGCIRPQHGAHYGLRQFGLSSHENERHFAKASFFAASQDLTLGASRLKKDELQRIAKDAGLDYKKSAKKDELVALIMTSDRAKELISQASTRELVEVLPTEKSAFDDWQARVRSLHGVALCLAVI